MKVKISKLSNDSKYYLLTNDDGIPITDACKYLKFISAKNLSHSTISSYAYNLATYFEYLEKYDLNYLDINTEIFSEFITYMYESNTKSFKSMRSIVITINRFYEFLSNSSIDSLNKNKIPEVNIKFSKVEKKEKLHIIEDIESICNLTSNIRDELLVRIIYETGLRANEVINLCIDDIVNLNEDILYCSKPSNCDNQNKLCLECSDSYICKYGIKAADTSTSFTRIIPISEKLSSLIFEYDKKILSDTKSDKKFIFIHLNSISFGKKLSVQYVSNCLKSLSSKSDIKISTSILKHSFISSRIKL